MQAKTKITLTPEQETLLIPLFARGKPDNPLFFDPWACQILDRVDYDFSRLRVPYKTVVLVCQRAKKLDAEVRSFLKQHPDGIVLHLACGLDSRFWRVDNGQVAWVDLDMAPVISLRREFFPDHARCRLIAASVTDLEWLDSIDAAGRAVMVVAEGLLMYLSEAVVRRLVLALQQAFPGCRLAADVFSRMTARAATNHPSLKKTGAALGWGVDDPGEIETWGPGIRLVEEWFFTNDPDLARLSPGFRFAYRLAGAFKMVQRAHRIVIFDL